LNAVANEQNYLFSAGLLFAAIGRNRIISTTRNSALALIMRAYASRPFPGSLSEIKRIEVLETSLLSRHLEFMAAAPTAWENLSAANS